jgi:hypothetical protein
MIKGGKLKAAKMLIKKKLGFRYLMNIIPLDATLVKGSHGVLTETDKEGPILLSTVALDQTKKSLPMEHFSETVENFYG